MSGKPFEPGADWLKNLVVVIKNVSNKGIVGGSLAFDVPRNEPIGSSSHPYHMLMMKTIYFGRMPKPDFYRDWTKERLLQVRFSV